MNLPKYRFLPLIELAIDQPLDDLPAISNKQMEYKELLRFMSKFVSGFV
jgi:hypothetical protein